MSPRLKSLSRLFVIFLLFSLEVPQGQAQQSALNVVRNYQTLHNSGQIEAVMDLFTSNTAFELVGQGTLRGQTLRAIHEYDIGINSRLAFINCEIEANVVTCQAVEFNDWLEAAGLQPVLYTSSIIMVDDARITRMSATMSAESAQAIGETLRVFIPWLMENHPNAATSLFGSDGMFIYSQANGELIVQLLQEWRAIVG
ncbi:MAG: hypothetical protein L6Q98_15560 [Anaerolineae bacterium]|nr:hypothetical protein [Anaerolineae bacterium]NUQ04787.1 hypothetical protein [Anaerolineae bacterium]